MAQFHGAYSCPISAAGPGHWGSAPSTTEENSTHSINPENGEYFCVSLRVGLKALTGQGAAGLGPLLPLQNRGHNWHEPPIQPWSSQRHYTLIPNGHHILTHCDFHVDTDFLVSFSWPYSLKYSSRFHYLWPGSYWQYGIISSHSVGAHFGTKHHRDLGWPRTITP